MGKGWTREAGAAFKAYFACSALTVTLNDLFGEITWLVDLYIASIGTTRELFLANYLTCCGIAAEGAVMYKDIWGAVFPNLFFDVVAVSGSGKTSALQMPYRFSNFLARRLKNFAHLENTTVAGVERRLTEGYTNMLVTADDGIRALKQIAGPMRHIFNTLFNGRTYRKNLAGEPFGIAENVHLSKLVFVWPDVYGKFLAGDMDADGGAARTLVASGPMRFLRAKERKEAAQKLRDLNVDIPNFIETLLEQIFEYHHGRIVPYEFACEEAESVVDVVHDNDCDKSETALMDVCLLPSETNQKNYQSQSMWNSRMCGKLCPPIQTTRYHGPIIAKRLNLPVQPQQRPDGHPQRTKRKGAAPTATPSEPRPTILPDRVDIITSNLAKQYTDWGGECRRIYRLISQKEQYNRPWTLADKVVQLTGPQAKVKELTDNYYHLVPKREMFLKELQQLCTGEHAVGQLKFFGKGKNVTGVLYRMPPGEISLQRLESANVTDEEYARNYFKPTKNIFQGYKQQKEVDDASPYEPQHESDWFDEKE